jgi:1-acyl-sn-glycerol-3-phosphate acyltransferase
MLGMPVKVTGSAPPKQRFVIVANHISYLDTLVIFAALPGYFRALGKKEISAIPIIGFIYKQLVIMVNRDSHHSRAMSMRLMGQALKNEGSIVVFPEGTFNETGGPLKSFYDGAFRLAINTQTPLLPIIFPDTVHRWHYSAWWKLWPGVNRAVYLDPVDVTGLTPAQLPQLKQNVYSMMENALLKLKEQPVP